MNNGIIPHTYRNEDTGLFIEGTGMHELPVTQSICNIAVEEGKRQGARQIEKITICQGDYTDYVPEVIQEYFNLVSEGTIAQGASIIIRKIPAVLYCSDCNTENIVKNYRMRCPVCNGANTTLKSGKEFYIESMEIEEDGD